MTAMLIFIISSISYILPKKNEDSKQSMGLRDLSTAPYIQHLVYK